MSKNQKSATLMNTHYFNKFIFNKSIGSQNQYFYYYQKTYAGSYEKIESTEDNAIKLAIVNSENLALSLATSRFLKLLSKIFHNKEMFYRDTDEKIMSFVTSTEYIEFKMATSHDVAMMDNILFEFCSLITDKDDPLVFERDLRDEFYQFILDTYEINHLHPFQISKILCLLAMVFVRLNSPFYLGTNTWCSGAFSTLIVCLLKKSIELDPDSVNLKYYGLRQIWKESVRIYDDNQPYFHMYDTLNDEKYIHWICPPAIKANFKKVPNADVTLDYVKLKKDPNHYFLNHLSKMRLRSR